MIDIKKILIMSLSGLTKYKNKREIYLEDRGRVKTIEIKDAEKKSYILRQYHKNGKLASLTNVACGKRTEYTQWHDNGRIKRKAKYRKGKLHGQIRTYTTGGRTNNITEYIFGNIVERIIYMDGKQYRKYKYTYGTYYYCQTYEKVGGSWQMIRWPKHWY